MITQNPAESNDKLTPIVFVGGSTTTPIERTITETQRAVALDTLDRCLESGCFARPIVATNSEVFANTLAGRLVDVELDSHDYHFGRQLQLIIHRHSVARPFYIGGGSTPLLSTSELAAIARSASESSDSLIANNFYSCDFVAFSPGSAIDAITLPAIDNDLAFLLQRQAHLQNVPLARTASTQMDVDTPTDLAVLKLHPATGPITRAYLESVTLDTSRVRSVMRLFTNPLGEIIVAGRVGSHVLAHLETDLACRKRIFSEERGMRAAGREARGEVRSLLGYLLDAVGPAAFFADFADLGQALLLDTRVLFAHRRLTPSAADRFNSDLLRSAEIADPYIRELTAAARDASLPVLLGGHSLVSGGLWALIEIAWQEHDHELAIDQAGASGQPARS